MSDYIIDNNELYHYGVLGMKWGVRRASSKLSKSTTKEERDKAIEKLNKHKIKATSKINKLSEQRIQLQKDVDKQVTKNDRRAILLKQKSTKLKEKAARRFTSEARAQKLIMQAMQLDIKSDRLKARSDLAKNELAKNETMTRIFTKGIADIDKIILDNGRKVVNGQNGRR